MSGLKKKVFLFPLIIAIPVALVSDYVLQFAPGAPRELPLNLYLVFFTVQANLLTLIWAVGELRGAAWARHPSFRTWLLVYLSLTALVFVAVLLPHQVYQHSAVWLVDLALHPGVWLAVVWDYFRNPPPVRPRYLPLVLVYPTAYLGLVLVVGQQGWYPYEFLDPGKNPFVVVTVVGLGLVVLLLGWAFPRLATWALRFRRTR